MASDDRPLRLQGWFRLFDGPVGGCLSCGAFTRCHPNKTSLCLIWYMAPMHPLLASKIANWLPFFILIVGCGSAWADTPKTDGGQSFLGQPIDDEPLSGEKRQMLALANRIRQPIRPPRTGGNAADVPWLNNSYRKRVERDRQALGEFGRLAAKLPDDTQNNALILVLGAFIAEENLPTR